MSELRKCPFCGEISENISIYSDDECDTETAYVECNNCYANGPHKMLEVEAIRDWNTRPIEDKLINALKLIAAQRECLCIEIAKQALSEAGIKD